MAGAMIWKGFTHFGDTDVAVKLHSAIKEGDMVIMPAQKHHALKALSPFKMLLVMIRA